MTLIHSLLSSYNETEVYKVNLPTNDNHYAENGSHVLLTVGHPNPDDSYPDSPPPFYRMRIFYKDVEIFDSGSSSAVDENGNPLNWPPKATDNNGSSNYPSLTTNGVLHRLAYKSLSSVTIAGSGNTFSNGVKTIVTSGLNHNLAVGDKFQLNDSSNNNKGTFIVKTIISSISFTFETHTPFDLSVNGGTVVTISVAQPRHYLIPDVHYDVIKNGISIVSNSPPFSSNIEDTLPAGSHFLLGDLKTETSFNLGGVPGRFSRHYYFSLIRLNNPPPIYRNSLALEDSSDNDFNDLIVTVTSGSGFFTGDVKENTVTNTSTNINVGNQVSFTTTGTFTWTVPDGIASVSAVCVGAGGGAGGSGSCDTALSGWAGGGGGGGGLSYGTFDVTPGETLTIIVGAGGAGGSAAGGQQTIICPTVGSDGGDSEIKRNSTALLKAGGGGGGQMGGSTNGIQQNNTGGSSGTGNEGTKADGGGNGGVGGRSSVNFAGGAGGGAAGYSGNGGRGRDGNSNSIQTGTSNGSGGGGSGGTSNGSNCGGGGGVGVDNGEGSSGSTPTGSGQGGNGGSGGGNGSVGDNVSTGGNYGGGGGSDDDDPPTPGGPGRIGGAGANGVVRIIWGNVNNNQREYPSTSVSDTFESGDWGKFTNNSFIANETGQFNFTTFRHAGNRNSFLLYKNSNDYILLKASSTNSIGASTTVAGFLTKGTYEVYVRKGNNVDEDMYAQVQSIDVDKYPNRAFYNPNP